MPRPRRRTDSPSAKFLSRVLTCVLGLLVGVHATFDVRDCHDKAVVSTVVGAGVSGNRDGRFERSFLSSPAGVSCNASTCVVGDSGNNVVRVIDLGKSEVTNFAGNGTEGSTDGKTSANAELGETQALFKGPTSVALLASGDVLVADTGNKAVRNISNGDVTTVVASLPFAPIELVVDESNGGDMYVLGQSQHGVMKISVSTLAVTTIAGSQTTSGFVDHNTGTSARFTLPRGLALDSLNSKLYVADTGNHAVRMIDLSTGVVTTVLGDGSPALNASTLNKDGVLSTPARFNDPVGIAYNYDSALSSGVLLVSDAGTHQLRKLILNDSTAGNAATVVTVAGSYTGTAGFRDDAVGSAAMFYNPEAVSYIGSATYIVADRSNHAIRKARFEAPVDITFTMHSVANIEKSQESHDLVIEEYGSYSVDGPPYNETTHFSGILTYVGEVHELTMCAYPSVEYFVRFEGAMQATVKDSNNFLYIGYTGSTASDSLSRTFKISGPGCTDSSSPNYNPFATSDDGSCVTGVKLLFTVEAFGVIDHAVYEFEGPGIYVSDSFEPESGEDGHEQTIDFEFVAYPSAIYTAYFYGALNASLTTIEGQSGLGSVGITYWIYNSTQVSDEGIKKARVTGPGCVEPSYTSYDSNAVESDELNACFLMPSLRVTLNASASAESWYDYGSIIGHADNFTNLYGIALVNSTDQMTMDLQVKPGVYELESYGDVSASVERHELGGAFTTIVAWDGTNSALRYDAYGFSTTTGSERVVFAIPTTFTYIILNGVVGYAGGVLYGDDSKSTALFAEGTVPWLQTITSTLTSVTSTTSLKNTLWYSWNVNILGVSPYLMSLTPSGFTFNEPVQLSINYDATAVPSQEGNEDIILFRASSTTITDIIAFTGATFDASTSLSSAPIDVTGMYGVAFRATVRSISPSRAWIDGDVTVTLDGVDFSSLSSVNVATTYQKCRWGETFTTAKTVASSDIRSTLSGSDSTVMGTKINAVSCPSPTVDRAGFTIVEFYDSKNGMMSDTQMVFLLTTAPKIASIFPTEGVLSGGTLVSVYGKYFRSALSASETYDGDSSFFTNGGPVSTSSVFGATASGCVLVSSSFARCESPPSNSVTSVSVRLGTQDYKSTGGYDIYAYVSDFTSGSSTAYTDNSGDSSFTDGGVEVDLSAALGSATKQRTSFHEWRCLFGTTSVAVRRDAYGTLSCISTSLSRGSAVDVKLVGPDGENSTSVGTISAPTIESMYVDSTVTLPGIVKPIETIGVIKREHYPMFWEPLKWVSTAHALVSPPGGSWFGIAQGYGYGTHGDPNCTFTTDAGNVTTRVAVVISSAVVVCETPDVETLTWADLAVTMNDAYSGSPRTPLPVWFEPVSRAPDALEEDQTYAWYNWQFPGWPSTPDGAVLYCYFGDSIEPVSNYTQEVGCIPPHTSAPGFVTVAIDVAGVAPEFYNQMEIVEPLRATSVLPRVLSAHGGSIAYFYGTDLFTESESTRSYCRYSFTSLESTDVYYVSSAMVRCEITASESTDRNSEMKLTIGRDYDLNGIPQREISLSHQNSTIRALFNGFGVRTIVSPTLTRTSPAASTALGGAVFGVTGTSFATETDGSRCVFGSIYVAANVYNTTYADCVTPALVPQRTYAVSFSIVGSASQRLVDVEYSYANGTAISYTPY